MIDSYCEGVPSGFDIKFNESFGWYSNVRLIVNEDYNNQIPMEWYEHVTMPNGIRYSNFITSWTPDRFNLKFNQINTVRFLYYLDGIEKHTEIEEFFLCAEPKDMP